MLPSEWVRLALLGMSQCKDLEHGDICLLFDTGVLRSGKFLEEFSRAHRVTVASDSVASKIPPTGPVLPNVI